MTPMRHPADGRVHLSELKQHARSPAHVKFACEHAREMTRPMLVGAIADCLVFGGRGYALYPGKVRNGKEWDAFKAEHRGKFLCIQSELDDATGAAEAVLSHPVARDLLDGADYQRVMQWDAYGLPCAAGVPGERGGFDAIHTKHRSRRPYIADLKVTSSTEPEDFTKHAIRMCWPQQGAWYLDGAEALCLDAEDFYLIGVEAQPPHVVTVLHLPHGCEALEMGRRSLRLWTEKHRACEDAEAWPGYVQVETPFVLPEWMHDYAGEAAA